MISSRTKIGAEVESRGNLFAARQFAGLLPYRAAPAEKDGQRGLTLQHSMIGLALRFEFGSHLPWKNVM